MNRIRPLELVGFTGYAGAGKDTAAEALIARGFERLAFADAMRTMLYALDPLIPIPGTSHHGRLSSYVDVHGWQTAKTNVGEIRELLQRLGTEAGRRVLGETIWMDATFQHVRPDGRYVVTDVRFDDEAERIHDFGGRVYRIERPGVGPVNGHATEAGISEELVDATISNVGTIDEFHSKLDFIFGE